MIAVPSLRLLLLDRRVGAATLAPPTTSLQLWLKGDSITGLSDGASVATWADSSGNGRIQSANPNAPTYVASGLNGRPGVRFNGTNQGFGSAASGTLISALAGTGNQYTIVTVFRAAAISVSEPMASYLVPAIVTDGGGLVGVHLVKNGGTSKVRSYLWTGGDTFLSHDIALNAGVRHVYYRDTGPDTIHAKTNSGSLISTGAANDATPTTRLIIGRNYTSAAWFDGELYELLIYSAPLSAEDLTLLDAYLVQKYGT